MNTTDLPNGARRWWLFFAVAAATFLPALGFHYVGEEAIFPISSLEMWYHGEWLRQLLFGGSLQHPPLFNWLIIPLATAVGWEHMLGVARAIVITATILTGLIVGWLAHVLYRDRVFAAFAAAVYITLADVFFYRGSLAYVDPLFALFVAAAVACLWAACVRRELVLLALATGALTAAFLSKALTAYVFYGVAGSVLLLDRQYRTFLLSPAAWFLHALAVALPLAWFTLVPVNTGQGARMFADILAKLSAEGLADYAVKLVAYPLETAVRLAPALFIAAYCFWKRRPVEVDPDGRHTRNMLVIALLSYAPYWLAPQSGIRYLLPLYPLAALFLARAIWRAGAPAKRLTLRWLIAAVVAKLVIVLAVFPYYQSEYRGANYATVAREILKRTAGEPLYTTNVSASGLAVAAHLDILRLPQPPLTFPPARWDSGFVIAYEPDLKAGRIAARYRLGGNDLYLLCRGTACDSVKR